MLGKFAPPAMIQRPSEAKASRMRAAIAGHGWPRIGRFLRPMVLRWGGLLARKPEVLSNLERSREVGFDRHPTAAPASANDAPLMRDSSGVDFLQCRDVFGNRDAGGTSRRRDGRRAYQMLINAARDERRDSVMSLTSHRASYGRNVLQVFRLCRAGAIDKAR